MKNHLLIFTVLLFTTLYSCNSKEKENSDAATAECMLIPPPPPQMEEVQFTPPLMDETESKIKENNSNNGLIAQIDKKKIIRDGDISIKVTAIQDGKKSIDVLVKKLNAYYENEGFENNENTSSFHLKIRIPANNFELFLTGIENGTGEITSKNIQARDVTEEFVDTETRLKNKKLYLKRYNEILSKAATVKDILEIEENIRNLQEEIESTEGHLKYLSDQVAISTLNIYLFQEKEYVYKPQQQDKFLERVKKSLSNGWTSVVDLILWGIKNWPGFITALLLLIPVKRFIKKRKGKQF
jgi:Domain of unknown function (DUF4349)